MTFGIFREGGARHAMHAVGVRPRNRRARSDATRKVVPIIARRKYCLRGLETIA